MIENLRNKFQRAVLLMVMTGFCFSGYSQVSTNILRYGTSSIAPSATIKDVLWMQGNWQCAKWKGICHENWSDSVGHAMASVFQYQSNGKINIYELINVSEVASSLVMKLKHFNKDLKGWEHKDSTVTFRLLRIEPKAAYFDGITYKRIDQSHLDVFVILGKQGEQKEEVFHFEKR